MALSEARDPARRLATEVAGAGCIPSSVNEPRVGTRAEWIRGELARGDDPRGEADTVGALNGWTEKELRRLAATARREFREV